MTDNWIEIPVEPDDDVIDSLSMLFFGIPSFKEAQAREAYRMITEHYLMED